MRQPPRGHLGIRARPALAPTTPGAEGGELVAARRAPRDVHVPAARAVVHGYHSHAYGISAASSWGITVASPGSGPSTSTHSVPRHSVRVRLRNRMTS